MTAKALRQIITENRRPRRRSQPHRKKRRRKQPRRQINAGNTHKRNGDNVMKKRQAGFPAGAEIAAEAEMNARKNTVENITAQILPAQTNNL